MNTHFTPSDKQLSNFCCPPQVSDEYSLFVIAWALAHRATENEKLLAQQENLPVPDDWTALFSSPDFINTSFLTHV